MQLTIQKIARFTTNKEGTALVNKLGKPYTSVRIQVAEHPGKWISGFGNAENASWKEGDTVNVEVEQKGEYLNFSMPKKADISDEKLEVILNRITGISLKVESIYAAVVKKDKPSLNGPTAFDDSPFSDGPLPSDDDAF